MRRAFPFLISSNAFPSTKSSARSSMSVYWRANSGILAAPFENIRRRLGALARKERDSQRPRSALEERALPFRDRPVVLLRRPGLPRARRLLALRRGRPLLRRWTRRSFTRRLRHPLSFPELSRSSALRVYRKRAAPGRGLLQKRVRAAVRKRVRLAVRPEKFDDRIEPTRRRG